MHLVFFPLIVYLIATVPILLLWRQRGLSQRNYWLSIGASMGGLVTGFVLSLLLNEYIPVGFLLFAMFVGLPVGFAILVVQKFGIKRRSISNPDSVKAQVTSVLFLPFLLAAISGLFVSIACAWLLDIEFVYIAMAATIVLPLTLFVALIQANYLKLQTISTIIKKSLFLSFIILLSSFVLGPYFMLGLPLVLYSFVASFVFLYVNYKYKQT